MSPKMKVRAEDAEDLQVVAAHLQDAIVPIDDMDFQPTEHRFVFVANRFKWESTPETLMDEDGQSPAPVYERTNCGVRIEGVAAVRCKNIDRKNHDQMLALLTLDLEDDSSLLMHFAGGACLRLELSNGWRCCVEDIGEPWPTRHLPAHAIEDVNSAAAGG